MYPNIEQGKSCRILLQERQGHGFSETEVTRILQQVLPQLADMHEQGTVHGGISIDTLVQDQSSLQMTLVANLGCPTTSEYVAAKPIYSEDKDFTEDIYALGITIIVLLTGQQSEPLQNKDNFWQWQNQCVISNHLATILDKALLTSPSSRFANAMEMLTAVNNSAPIAPDTTSTERLAAKSKSSTTGLASLLWIMLGTVIPVVLGLAGFGIFKMLNSKSELPTTANVALPTPVNNANPISTSTVPTPLLTPTPEISPASVAPTLTPTSNPSATPTPSSTTEISPTQVMRDYYALINSRQYEAGWNQLTTQFRSNESRNPKGFLSYVNWWESVATVDVQQANLISQSSQEAVVDVDVTYSMKKGKTSSDSLRFLLVKDIEKGGWMISDVLRK